MSDTQIEWRRITNLDRPPVGIEDGPALTAFLSKIFHYCESRNMYAGRNVYGGNWSNKYLGDASFHFDRNILKREIELKRKRGSQFTLIELPALVLMSKQYDLLLFLDHWEDKPFNRVPRNIVSGKAVFEIARSICKHEQFSNIFILPRGKSLLAILPFKTFQSVSHGSDCLLGWKRLRHKYDINSIMALITDVAMHVNEG